MTNWAPRRGAGGSIEAEHEIERRTRQIKEMVRLGAALRAEMGLANIFIQLVEAINTTLGFNVAALNIVREQSDYVEVVATAGLSPRERDQLTQRPPRLESLLSALRPEFCISHSYFISHHNKALLYSIDGITLPSPTPPPHATDAWHPDDALLVPLISPRDDRLLGILSLDQPVDGKAPTLDTIEMIELFAGVAALAIDTSRIFQEREEERQNLREGLFELLFQMEQVRLGNLTVRPQFSGNSLLDPITESLNATLVTLNNVLAEVRGASEMVNLSAAEMRTAALELADNAQQQSDQMLGVSQTIETMAHNVRQIAEMADTSDAEAQGASEISHEGRDAATRAAEGMSRVREMTLQAAKKVKRLGESSQEIGAIVQTVSDFTNQTNLLALNAAIEAARAGEHGRGFAIVAQEIRNLATSSAEATRQIHARIQSVQNETSQVVSQIEHTTQQVVLQSEYAAAAGAALEAVDTSTQRIAREIERMRALANEQSNAATQLAQAITRLASNVTQTRDSMDQTRASMDYLVELAVALLRKIDMFRLDVDEPPATSAYSADDPLADFLGTQTGAMGPMAPTATPSAPPSPMASTGSQPIGRRSSPSLPAFPPSASAAPVYPVYPMTNEAPPSASATRNAGNMGMGTASWQGASRAPERPAPDTRAPQPSQSSQAPHHYSPPVGWLTPLDDVEETAKQQAAPPSSGLRALQAYPAPAPYAAPVTAPIPAIDPFAPLSELSAAAAMVAAPVATRQAKPPIDEASIPAGAPNATTPAAPVAGKTTTPLPESAAAQPQGEAGAPSASLTSLTSLTSPEPARTSETSGTFETPETPEAFEAQETQPMPAIALSDLAGHPGETHNAPPLRRMTAPLPLSALIPPNVASVPSANATDPAAETGASAALPEQSEGTTETSESGADVGV